MRIELQHEVDDEPLKAWGLFWIEVGGWRSFRRDADATDVERPA